MENCSRCGKTEEEVRLFDGVYINENINVCERCALVEGIPLLKLPSTGQLKGSERTDYVYKRLRKIAGFKDEKQEKGVFEELQELEDNPERVKPNTEPLRLIDNFHWAIQHERRHKGLTHKQLADAIGESEMAIKLLERNNFPEDSMPMIRKLEQYFRIKLIKLSSLEETRQREREEEEKSIKQAEIIVGDSYNEIIEGPNHFRQLVEEKKEEEVIEEKKPISKPYWIGGKINENTVVKEKDPHLNEMKEKMGDDMVREAIRTEPPEIKKFEEVDNEPLRVLDFKKDKLDKITIADLKEIQRKVESDFPTKSSEEIGKEQLDNFGKRENVKEVLESKNKWFDKYINKKQKQIEKSIPEKVPSIHELAEKKGIAKSHESKEDEVLGDDIEVIE